MHQATTALVIIMGVNLYAALAARAQDEEISFSMPLVEAEDAFVESRRAGESDPFEERIETERHDFTQSTTTVGRGVVQFEAGYSYFYKDENEEREQSHTTPELLVRIGLAEHVEFRVRYNEVWRFVDEHAGESGSEDLRWGLKLRATDQCNWVPESAVELRFTAPTGSREWSTERVEFGLDYIYGWRLNERAEIYGSTGFATNALGDFSLLPDEQAGDHFMLYTQSVALGYEMTEQTTLYTEFFGLFADGLAEDQNPVFFNVGVDFYVTDDVVVDFRVGMGLNGDSDDLFAGAGGGWRF